MSLSLTGRVAIVTGAGNGLGRCYALLLAELGAAVVVNDIGAASGPEARRSAELVVEEITRLGGRAMPSYHDISVASETEALAAIAQDAFGRTDILVHNAGILRDKTLVKMSEADLRAVIDVHLIGGILCTRAVLPAMYKQGYGRIVLATSSSGLYGLFGQSNYAAAKMGLVGFANAMKFELRSKGVVINCIAPSAMTRMTEGLVEERIAVKLRAEYVAPAVAYLASEECTFTGRIMTAGARHFAMDCMMESAGITLDPADGSMASQIGSRIGEIADMTGATPFESGHDQLQKLSGFAT